MSGKRTFEAIEVDSLYEERPSKIQRLTSVIEMLKSILEEEKHIEPEYTPNLPTYPASPTYAVSDPNSPTYEAHQTSSDDTEPYFLNVRSLIRTGYSYTIFLPKDATASYTVRDLKKKLELESGIDYDMIKLLFNYKELRGAYKSRRTKTIKLCTLKHYGIKSGDKILMVLK